MLVDGKPVRSCITFAVACEGRRVTTIEGYDDDAVMQLLRPAFIGITRCSAAIAHLEMLTTARDIVLRMPEADEARVRLELSGNLCRCTGYHGIVDAILDVLPAAASHSGHSDRGASTRVAFRTGRCDQAGCRCRSVRVADSPARQAGRGKADSEVDVAEVDPIAMAKAKANGNSIAAHFDVLIP